MKLTRKKLLVSMLLISLVSVAYLFYPRPSNVNMQSSNNLPTFAENELIKYNGTNPDLPIYLAMDGYVYDVTSGKEFYEPGGSYHDLAGKDSSVLLHIAGGSIIQKKYKIVGILKK